MKIYISATFKDLCEYREAVAGVLRRVGHQPLGMEDYVAEGQRRLQRCLADVDVCDAYIGILAWRHGYVPEETAPPTVQLPSGTDLNKTSITEFEYRQAVEKNKRPLMFVLDPDAEWPAQNFDAVTGEGNRGEEVTRFRREVAEQHFVSFFRTPEDLASLVSAAVYRLEMDRQMNLESLRMESRLNQPFIRSGPVQDSTLMEIKNVVAGPQDIQALQINIGQGLDWWVTRLYFLSSLTADLTEVELIVFVGEGEGFIGATSPRIVRECLARSYSILAEYENLVSQGNAVPDLQGEVQRRADVWNAYMQNHGTEESVKAFVTKRELKRWFGAYMIKQAIDWETGDVSAFQIQRLIDWPMRFVPVVENGKFARVVDKQALTEQVARLPIREQVSRARSMSR